MAMCHSISAQGFSGDNHDTLAVIGSKVITVQDFILAPVMADDEMLTVVTQHHERCDGRGYPKGDGASAISLYARITAGADTLDAMCSSRPYRPAMSRDAAAAELRRCRGTQLDAQVVDAILEMLDEEARAETASPASDTQESAGVTSE